MFQERATAWCACVSFETQVVILWATTRFCRSCRPFRVRTTRVWHDGCLATFLDAFDRPRVQEDAIWLCFLGIWGWFKGQPKGEHLLCGVSLCAAFVTGFTESAVVTIGTNTEVHATGCGTALFYVVIIPAALLYLFVRQHVVLSLGQRPCNPGSPLNLN